LKKLAVERSASGWFTPVPEREANAIMVPGRVDRASPFHEFPPERHVPANHLLRAIDHVVDLSGPRRDRLWPRPAYRNVGLEASRFG